MVQRKTTFAVAVQVQNAVLVEFVAGRTLVARTGLSAWIHTYRHKEFRYAFYLVDSET